MSDGLPVRTFGGEIVVDVKWIKIPSRSRKLNYIRLGNGPPRTDPNSSHYDVIEIKR